MIDCREAVRRMWTYLDESLDSRPTAELETHLQTCQRCCGELEFSRHVRQMVATGDGPASLPVDVRRRIEDLIGSPASEGGASR
jgi:mycothiol system anti-sigma-R factor